MQNLTTAAAVTERINTYKSVLKNVTPVIALSEESLVVFQVPLSLFGRILLRGDCNIVGPSGSKLRARFTIDRPPSVPPAPRLVGIETNPGPPKTKKKTTKPTKPTKPKNLNARQSKNLGIFEPNLATVPGITRFATASDGLNSGMVAVNASRPAQRFVRRFEKVMDINYTTAAPTILYINPGNTLLHTLTSTLYSYYEQYQYKRLVVHYKSITNVASGSNITNGQLGLGVDYDVDDATWPNFAVLQGSDGGTVAPTFTSFKFDVLQWLKVARKNNGDAYNNRYVYLSANAASPVSNIGKLYDLGKLYIWPLALPSAGKYGEIWLEEELEMYRPQVPPSLSISTPSNLFLTAQARGIIPSLVNPTGYTGFNVLANNLGSGVTFTQSGYTFNFTGLPVGQIMNVLACAYWSTRLISAVGTATSVGLGANSIMTSSPYAGNNYEAYGGSNDGSYPGISATSFTSLTINSASASYTYTQPTATSTAFTGSYTIFFYITIVPSMGPSATFITQGPSYLAVNDPDDIVLLPSSSSPKIPSK